MSRSFALIAYGCLKKRKIQDIFAKIIAKCEGGEMYSKTIREIYRIHHGINVGLYSYGCFFNDSIRPGVSIGRYCSISHGVSIMDANHPLHHKSTHPFFYEPSYKYVKESYIQHIPIVIENDVWIGKNSIIIPSVRRIGNGVVIAAGSVVTKDVPSYAIVAGNPAKIIRFRFQQEVIDNLEKEKWWQYDIEELRRDISKFTHFDSRVLSD